MNLNSPIYSTMLSNKFLIWGLILCISDFGRSRDQNGSGGSVYTGSLFDGTFDQLQLIRATLIFKMQKIDKTNKLCSY